MEWETFQSEETNKDFPPENVFLYYGPKIKNWKSASFTKEDREANSLLRVSLGLEDSKFIHGSDFDTHFVNIKKYIANSDSLYQFFAKVRGMEEALKMRTEQFRVQTVFPEQPIVSLTGDLSTVGSKEKYALQVEVRFDGKRDLAADPRWGGYSECDLNWIPRTEENYRVILNGFTRLIN